MENFSLKEARELYQSIHWERFRNNVLSNLKNNIHEGKEECVIFVDLNTKEYKFGAQILDHLKENNFKCRIEKSEVGFYLYIWGWA